MIIKKRIDAFSNLRNYLLENSPILKKIIKESTYKNSWFTEESVTLSIQGITKLLEKEKLEKIFDRFYQVDSTSKRKIGGCGLGLTIASGIIRAHGSEIHVESEPGCGSTFSFRLKKAEL